MGHARVRVLRGGLPAWKAAGLSLSGAIPAPTPVVYKPQFQNQKIMDLKTLKKSLKAENYLVLDARPKARFDGTAPEPRVGLRSGHMPGSRSLPSSDLIKDGALKPTEDLARLFAARGLNANSRVVTSCGSGVTAAILSMALDELGHTATALYDGSWAEWGQINLDTPVTMGES